MPLPVQLILSSTRIRAIDKLILQLVDSFATGRDKNRRLTGPCTAANECIAMYLGEGVSYVTKRLAFLQRAGLIIALGKQGIYIRRVVAPELSKDREITEKWIAKYGRS